MDTSTSSLTHFGFWIVVLSAFVAGRVGAAEQSHSASKAAWQFDAAVYLYLPTLNTKSAFPADSSGTRINISSDQILENLQAVFMGSLEVHRETWGVFTDVVYIDIAADKTQSRNFSIGDDELPVAATADLAYAVRGSAWTIAGEYRVASDSALTLDLLVGTRVFDLEQTLEWNISGDLGTLNAMGHSGTADISDVLWDALFGIKGRYTLGSNQHWSIPFFLDIGSGDSDLTWQAASGISYSFEWGRVHALWRYLSYELATGASIANFTFSGPQLGVAFRW